MKDDVRTWIDDHLGKAIKIKIDRPMGSKHPKHGFIYPVNYGYVPNIISGDGEELDAYLLGVFEPVDEYEGHLIGVIYRENDVEVKLVVAPKTYTSDQIMALVEFQEQWFKSWLFKIYDRPYWPDGFNVDMLEVQKALKLSFKRGSYSLSMTQGALEKGYGFVRLLTAWLEDNHIIAKRSDSKPRKLLVKSYEDAIKKLAA